MNNFGRKPSVFNFIVFRQTDKSEFEGGLFIREPSCKKVLELSKKLQKMGQLYEKFIFQNLLGRKF